LCAAVINCERPVINQRRRFFCINFVKVYYQPSDKKLILQIYYFIKLCHIFTEDNSGPQYMPHDLFGLEGCQRYSLGQ
jgi:hypothetical protein